MKGNWFFVLIALLFFSIFACAADLDVTSVNYDPTPAIPGSYFNIWVHLKNKSSADAKNVIFTLDLEKEIGAGTYPFSLDPGEPATKNLGTIRRYQIVLVEYKVKVDSEALNGNYVIKLKYGDDGAVGASEEYTIAVLSRRPAVEIIESSPEEAMPGQAVEVKLTVRNIGNDAAVDLLVGVEEDRTVTTGGVVVERDIAPLGASFYYIERLNPGKEKNVEITLGINPDAEMKTYTVPIKLKYKDTNATSYSITRYIGLMVYQDAALDSSISDVSPIAYPGGTSEITFDMFNTGIGDARYVVAELSAGIGEFDIQKTFIGTLEADDFDSFRSKLKLDSNVKTGEQPITLTLNYKDQYEQPQSVSKTLYLKVQSLAEAQAVTAQPLDIWFIVVVLIVLFFVIRFGYRKIRKKK